MVPQIVIIGGGVVGLTAAYELARNGARVTVLERGSVGREASWAGAGMLPPTLFEQPGSLVAELLACSTVGWPELSARLLEDAEIDNEFRRCGAIELTTGSEPLSHVVQQLSARNIRCQPLSACELGETHPWLQELPRESSAPDRGGTPNHAQTVDQEPAAVWLPDFHQVRNPRHMQALTLACSSRGVALRTGAEVREVVIERGRIRGVRGEGFEITGDRFVVCAGIGSRDVLAAAGMSLEIEPVRGQMVLFRAWPGLIPHVVEVGKRYLVPRLDGRVLAGSTEEWVGVDKSTTPAAIAELAALARTLVPQLATCELEQSWAGLRPHAPNGPIVAPAATLNNLFIATGHFRAGLQLSVGTAARIVAWAAAQA